MASITIPTAISAAAGLGSAVIGSSAAKSAAQTQAAAAGSAQQLQMQMFQQVQGNLAPYMAAGQSAMPILSGLLGTAAPAPMAGPAGASRAAPGPLTGQAAAAALGPTSGLFSGRGNSALQDIQQALILGKPVSDASWAQAGLPSGGGAALNPIAPGPAPQANPLGATTFDPQKFLEQTPGYQFTREQGLQAVQNSYAAKGLGRSGAALKGAAQFATGLADQTYESRLGDYFKLLGVGQASAAGLAGPSVQAGANIGETAMGVGSALAGGQVGAANALTGGLGTVAGAGSQYALLSALKAQGMFGGQAGNAGMTVPDIGTVNPNQIPLTGLGV